MPQFQLWDLPGSGADSFVEGFSVNRPAQGGLRRSRYDRNRGHEVVMQSNCAAAVYTLDRLRNIARKLLYHSLRTNVVQQGNPNPNRFCC